MRKAIAIMKKDFKEILRNFQVFGIMIILPVIFGVFYPLIVFFIAPNIPEEELSLILSIFNGFFLIMAVAIPTVVAADSFAGEKERKTIEALLAAPVSDSELFLGKVLVSFIPAITLTYGSAALYCTIVNLGIGKLILPDWSFLVLMAMVPLFALLCIELTVFISVRVKGFREAQQIAGVLIIPVIAIVFLNIINISVFTFPWNVIIFIALGGIDVALYGVAVKKFGRENIISKI